MASKRASNDWFHLLIFMLLCTSLPLQGGWTWWFTSTKEKWKIRLWKGYGFCCGDCHSLSLFLMHSRYDFNYTQHQSSFHPRNILKGNIQSNDTLWVLGVHVIWSIFLCFSISCQYHVFFFFTMEKHIERARETKEKKQRKRTKYMYVFQHM